MPVLEKRSKRKPCIHCGTPYVPSNHLPEGYCCHGCAYVHRLITAEGLERFYELRGETVHPVGSLPLREQAFEWLREKQVELEAELPPGSLVKARFHLQGISCVGCVWLIEKLFLRHAGAVRAAAEPQRGELRLQWIAGQLSLADFAIELQRHGYLLSPENTVAQSTSRELTTRLALCGAFALNAMLFTLPRYLGMESDFPLARLFSLLTLLFSTLSLVAGGSYFIARAARALRRSVIHIDLPIALGLVLAYLGSLLGWFLGLERFLYFDFVAIFTFLMLVGRWLQERTVDRNRNQISGQQAEPRAVTRLTPMGSERVPPQSLAIGDEIEIGPGEMVPVTGELVRSEATFSLEWINGESEPRLFPPGRIVPAGSASIERTPVQLRVGELWKNSLLARLLQPVERDDRSHFMEYVLRAYLGGVLLLALTGAAVWAFLLQDPLNGWQVALSVLVVSCPCALGVAIPLADELAIARLRSRGFFIKSHRLFGKLRGIRDFLFDKTGTLTLETPALQNPEALASLPPVAKAVLLKMVESSPHPLSRSLREQLLSASPDAPTTSPLEITETAGRGLIAKTENGERWLLGRPDWEGGSLNGEERTVDVVFKHEGTTLASFHFSDQLRSEGRTTIAELQKRYGVWILSGDRRDKVDALARELGLEHGAALSALSPDEKAAWVESRPKGTTLFVGDGANDSLAFDRAAIRGTPAINSGVLEHKADFYFLSQSLSGILDLLRVGEARNRAVKQIFAFAILYNVSAVGLCLTGNMYPLLAAILMPLSSLATLGIVRYSLRGR